MANSKRALTSAGSKLVREYPSFRLVPFFKFKKGTASSGREKEGLRTPPSRRRQAAPLFCFSRFPSLIVAVSDDWNLPDLLALFSTLQRTHNIRCALKKARTPLPAHAASAMLEPNELLFHLPAAGGTFLITLSHCQFTPMISSHINDSTSPSPTQWTLGHPDVYFCWQDDAMNNK